MIAVVVSCEHGGNRVPEEWAPLFVGDADLLSTHRGWDPGAADVARAFAAHLGAPLHVHDVTRLLVDTNRSVGHPRLFGERSGALLPCEKERILAAHYRPYRDAVTKSIADRLSPGGVVHVSVHTFTPVLDSRRRTTGIGFLYDPGREAERDIVVPWQEELQRLLPAIRIHRNRPYRGTSDALTTALRERFEPNDYMGLEVEVRSNLADGAGTGPDEIGELLAETLQSVL